MRDDLIYAKTPAGEEAVQERTRLVQRNLRMVLILVDGVVNVGGLKKEVGDPAMVESALAELERLGMIRSPESGTAVDQSEIETWPVAEPIRVTSAEPVEIPLVQADTVFDEETALQIQVATKYASRQAEPAQKGNWKSPLTDISDWFEAARKERALAREEAIYEEAYGKEVVDEVAPLPVKETGVTLVFRWSWLLVGAFGLVAASLLTLLLFPYDSYRPEFEQRLSRAVGDEVKVGQVRLAFTPYPVMVLDRVSVGSDPYLTANTVQLQPEFGSIVGPRYREVVLQGVRVKEGGLGKFSAWLLPAAMGDAAAERIEIDGLAIDLAGGAIEGLRGSARVDAEHGLDKLILRSATNDLRVEVTPRATGVGLDLSATAWALPFDPRLQFSFLELRGELVPGRLTLTNIDGRLYDGSLSGDGVITWAQESTVTMRLAFQRLASEQLLPALGAQPSVEGPVSGRVQVGGRAVAVTGLDRELRLDGIFAVERGSLRNVDLAEAIRSGRQTTLHGGTTRFQEFSGAFAADPRSLRFSGLRLSSGLLRMAGDLTVARDSGSLSGRAGVEMRGSAVAAKSTVIVSGSQREPDIRLSRGG